MEVTIHRGTKEIGGNCVEVSAGNTRLILDTGLPLVTEDREPFDAGIIGKQSVAELVERGVIPRVPGLFTDGPRPDAILLSHSHMDHSGLLHLTRPDIPIHATTGTSKMMNAGSIFSRQPPLDRGRHRRVKSGHSKAVGDITVTPFAVDHSAYGSVAYLLEAEGKTVLYSGDLRWHGRKPGMIHSLVAAARRRRIDALIMEGTHIGLDRGKRTTEEELQQKIEGLIAESRQLVVSSFSPIDVDRVVTYYKAAKAVGRVFVADAYTAYVLHLVHREAKVPWPEKAGRLRVYFNKAFTRKKIQKLEDRLARGRIELAEILANPTRYVMMFRPSMVEMDFGGRLPAGTRCLYSYWQGYLGNDDWTRCQDHLRSVGGDLVRAHTSGHIYKEDLVMFVNGVNPCTVIPIHTFEPGGFNALFSNARCLRDGETYCVE